MNSFSVLIVTDAWEPQVNGVYTTLKNLIDEIEKLGHKVSVLCHHDSHFSIPTPYPDVRFSFIKDSVIKEKLNGVDYIHISTPEGPIGNRVRKYCDNKNIPYTTGYHTNWEVFLKKMYYIPRFITRMFVKSIHKNSRNILAPSKSSADSLSAIGLTRNTVWTRGVDRELFGPAEDEDQNHYLLCVSRISKEKNLEEFFKLPGTKVMVGDGPMLETYKKKYPDVHFVGLQRGHNLVKYYKYAKCFVFPSKADTFGVVMIEALACGTPIAAYNVPGPIDVVENGVNGYLTESCLECAVFRCESLDRKAIEESSKKWSWKSCAEQFIEAIQGDVYVGS